MSNKIHSARVLICKDGDVLSFEDNFPGGELQEGEVPMFAAIRCCYNQTGAVVFVYPPSAYAGLNKDSDVTKVYRAEVVCGDVSGEWRSPDEFISKSKDPDFSESVLRNFGIR